ncbi:MAG: dTDP-4-dehydrorhamnose 3,5-epimerase [gamma proteobacterium symbiont of Bathyaustriella thionipta]|nr:dTDP-4-dehydrorhamnose 3,5-epimerase [gamma proteobacterium symbiont of Bathyaustriella thionipta]MCU7949181.1 dTDP-4-dehydrorhamnose 3,5-epimerase [gamma proteobacterium symbiont of Bathyaustriella thionipta]MCU7954785.1 dTDP-4-dehydrorhamnose 3,5-epimerase [gamma proteobacterium symbiont of Bathyaustriella thionipta]MCU7956922.1 dTDP-4-dehydrorhamnose 3,5-epimerase [gamma proteobacterium symbiont of Bathyaustriella thionipta]MCU7966790.1 dTDP-4-dehydrorhamnose 3,5-epimerase [gamma proteoba
MKFTKTQIPDIIRIEPQVFGDERGYFAEIFRSDLFEQETGIKTQFIQDNESRSSYGVLRGLHYQLPPCAQSKLVRVIEGKVLDVAVDIRKGSPTFGQHVTAELSAENKHQLFIPRGFAHGFVVLSDTALFAYKVDSYYSPECDIGIQFDDPQLKINWKVEHSQLQLSEKDKKQPLLQEATDLFDYQTNLYI